MDTRLFYVYGLYDPRDGALRYIGLSCNLKMRLRYHVNQPLRCISDWIADLKANGQRPLIEPIEDAQEYFPARRRERVLIRENARIHGATLLNANGRK